MCTDQSPDRLWIEIDIAAEPISGVIHHGSERASRFDGWLELVALLERSATPRKVESSPAIKANRSTAHPSRISPWTRNPTS